MSCHATLSYAFLDAFHFVDIFQLLTQVVVNKTLIITSELTNHNSLKASITCVVILTYISPFF